MTTKIHGSTYQELSDRLDGVMAKLQSPDVTIDDAVALYQQAMELIEAMEKHLTEAENKVRNIKARFTER